MSEQLSEFETQLNGTYNLILSGCIADFETKLNDNKWSKKEIIGHLIDSANNNIKRFCQIQTDEKPYKIESYHQDNLVKSNYYQSKNNDELLDLWLHLNRQIIHIVKNLSPKCLSYSIILPNGQLSNFEFLINDYIQHFYYHTNQIKTR